MCCQLQYLQVFAGGNLGRMSLAQLVVGHAKVTGRKHVFLVLVVLEGTRLTNQRIDDMSIIDRMLTSTSQSRHALN